MTIEKITPEQQEMRDFVDALRGFLGKAPLYFQGTLTDEQRFGCSGNLLPAMPDRLSEWFRPVATPSPGDRTQDRAIELAVRKLTSAGHREHLNQDRTDRRGGRWHASTKLDPNVRGQAARERGQLQFQRKVF